MRDTVIGAPVAAAGAAAPQTLLGVGVGLKPEHFAQAECARADGLWFEVHAENYMVDGGPRLGWLERIRACHPLSLHGVGLSLAGDAPPDVAHLARLAALVRRFEPALVSEHLAWSVRGTTYLPDLLPFPRSSQALARVADNVDRVQSVLGRRIALENPSHYLRIDGHDWNELDFLAEICRRTGCGLLLDLNNVHVSAHNLGFDALDYLARFPLAQVMQLHLAGHSRDPALGDALLVDSHDAAVAAPVWELYASAIARMGMRPTLIERDAELPEFELLMAERAQASALAAQSVAAPQPRASKANAAMPRARTTPAMCAGPSQSAAQGSLGAVQQACADVLRSERAEAAASDAPGARWATQPAFAVYRNTVMKGCIDALQANHPSVCRLVGEAWFRAAAALYARAAPPTEPRLLRYGLPGASANCFADFLEGFDPARELPYLAGVARLDGAWVASHCAADAPVADASALAQRDPAELGRMRLRPHPAARWHWFDTNPVFSIWSANRSGSTVDAELAWQGEGALITRPGDTVLWSPLSRAGCALLDACEQGLTLETAAQAALEHDPGCDLASELARLLRQGALLACPHDGEPP